MGVCDTLVLGWSSPLNYAAIDWRFCAIDSERYLMFKEFNALQVADMFLLITNMFLLNNE